LLGLFVGFVGFVCLFEHLVKEKEHPASKKRDIGRVVQH